jgi:hypothetical protein
MSNDVRRLRQIAATQDAGGFAAAIDRSQARADSQTANDNYIGVVFDTPTAVVGPRMVPTHPVRLTADESTAGGVVTPDIDTDTTVVVALTRGKVQNDDYLIADLKDGLWVAEKVGGFKGPPPDDCTGTLMVSVYGYCGPLTGVHVIVTHASDGSPYADGYTGDIGPYIHGVAQFEDVPHGDYLVTIDEIPDGYELNPSELFNCPDPRPVHVPCGTVGVSYNPVCQAFSTPAGETGCIKPSAGLWDGRSCRIGTGTTVTFPGPIITDKLPCPGLVPESATLSFGGHTVGLGPSGCTGFDCFRWMGELSWSGTGLPELNPFFTPTIPPGQPGHIPPCPFGPAIPSPYSADTKFYFQATKQGLTWMGPACTGAGGCTPAKGFPGLTLCNVWAHEFSRFGNPSGMCSHGIFWDSDLSSCDPLVLIGFWAPPPAYVPYWGHIVPISLTA